MRPFTLIELLLVIAVIAILAGLLLPVLNSAKESMKRVQCIANFKQLALGFASYQTNYNFLVPNVINLPKIGKEGKEETNWINWYYFIAPEMNLEYHGNDSIPGTGKSYGHYFGYCKGFQQTGFPPGQFVPPKTFFCPSGYTIRGNFGFNSSAHYNPVIGRWVEIKDWKDYALNTVKTPSGKAQLNETIKQKIDCAGGLANSTAMTKNFSTWQTLETSSLDWYTGKNYNTQQDWQKGRHAGKGIVLFLDMHVESLPGTVLGAHQYGIGVADSENMFKYNQ